jgi:hypothetical protein
MLLELTPGSPRSHPGRSAADSSLGGLLPTHHLWPFYDPVELEGNWSQTEELLYCLFYVKSLQQARELGEEEASERLGRMD